MSYPMTWNYLRLLTTQSQYADVVRSGHWMWVYDNLNIHQRVHHERTGERSAADSNSHIHVRIYIKTNVLFHIMHTIISTYARTPLRYAESDITHCSPDTEPPRLGH